DIRTRQSELFKKKAVHVLVVMLACMHEELLELIGVSAQLGNDRRHLHQIRSRAHNVDNLHWRSPAIRALINPLDDWAAVLSRTESMRRARAMRSYFAAVARQLTRNSSLRSCDRATRVKAPQSASTFSGSNTKPTRSRSTISADSPTTPCRTGMP